jgi:hypothetical protein
MVYPLQLPTKPYLKRYLEYLFRPDMMIDLTKPQGQFLARLLGDSTDERGSRYPGYDEVAILQFTQRIFNRYGFNLTRTNIVAFNRYLEQDLKSRVCQLIDIALGANAIILSAPNLNLSSYKIADAIREVQREFGFDEDTWSYESIRKVYLRYRDRKEAQKPERVPMKSVA